MNRDEFLETICDALCNDNEYISWFKMDDEADCRAAVFSMEEDNPEIFIVSVEHGKVELV